jgi:hypothetical protein
MAQSAFDMMKEEPAAQRKKAGPRERQRTTMESPGLGTMEMEKKARLFTDYGAFTDFAAKSFGGDVVMAFEAAKQGMAEEASKIADGLFPTKGNRATFGRAVRKFCDDSFSLLFAMVLMEGRLDREYSARVESALSQRAKNLMGFMRDFEDLKSPERTKERVLSTIATFKDEFPFALRQQLEKFEAGVRKGSHDETFAQISKVYTETRIGERKGFEAYFFINYRENAFFDIIALAVHNASVGMIKKDDMMAMFRRESPEQVFLFPSLFVPIYGADEFMKLRAGKVAADIPVDDALRAMLSEQEMWKDVPIRPAEQIIPPLGSVAQLIREMPSANVDAVSRAEANTLPPNEMKSFIFRRMAEKKISPVLDVVPSGCSMGERDGIRANSSSRTVQYGINDTFPEMGAGGSGISLMLHHLSDRMKFVNKMENALGYTDGAGIYLFPYYSRMPTRDLNAYLLFNVARHEFGHISMGSFEYTAGSVPKIDLFAPLEKDASYAQRYEKKGKENIAQLQEFINGVMQSVDLELGKRENGKATLREIYKSIDDAIKSHYKANKDNYAKNPYVKMFYEYFGTELYRNIDNVIDDYRIDRSFYDGKGRDGILNETGEAETDRLRRIYRVSTYLRAMNKAICMHGQFKDEPKKSSAIETLFLRTMLDDRSFTGLVGPSVDPLFRDICETAMSRVYKGANTPRRANETMCASMEFMALAMIFDDAIKPPKVMRQGKGGEGKGGEKEKEGKEGGKGEGEKQAGTPKEDLDREKGENKEGREEEDESQGDSPVDKDQNGNVNINKEEKKAGGREKEVEDLSAAERHGYETMEFPADKVEMFKQFFRDLRIDRMVIKTELGKRGARVDIDELARFMYRKGARNAAFLEKKVMETDIGSHLEARPIDIYIGIDTSGSMAGHRVRSAKTLSLEMLAGYNEVVAEMKAANIRLHMISVATKGDKIDIKDWDATKGLMVERKGDSYSVSYKFSEIGTGTDLPGMIGRFQEFVEEIKTNTIGEIVRGRNILNPSVMIMFITDFGDNRGDLDGVVSATRQFGAFAARYRADSKTVNYLSNDAGIATLFVVPDENSDDAAIENAIERATSGAVVKFTGDAAKRTNAPGPVFDENGVLEKLNALRPVLEGLRASNVVEKAEKEP